MASITIRQLDDDLKTAAAAARGRATAARWRTRSAPSCATPRERREATPARGSAAAAYEQAVVESRDAVSTPGRPSRRNAHPADHRRRHRGLQVARSHPPAARARRGGALHPHGGGAGIRHAARGRRAQRRARLHRSVRRRERVRRRPYPARARDRSRSWWRPRPPTSWPRWRAATPTISPAPCCSRPTGRC